MVRQAVNNDDAGPAHRHTTRRKSSVWRDFDYVHVPGAPAVATCRRCGSTFQASSKKHGTSALRRHTGSTCCPERAAKRAVQQAGPCLPAAAPSAAAADDGDEDEQVLCLPLAAAPAAAAEDDEDEQVPCLPAAAAPAADYDVEWQAMMKWVDYLYADPGYDAGLFSGEEQQDGGLTTTSSPSADLTTTDLPFTNGDHHRCSPNHGMPDMPQAHSSSSIRFFRKKRERSANSASHQGETTDKGHSSPVNMDWAPTVDDSMVYSGFTSGDTYD